jgi:hypothetical protein
LTCTGIYGVTFLLRNESLISHHKFVSFKLGHVYRYGLFTWAILYQAVLTEGGTQLIWTCNPHRHDSIGMVARTGVQQGVSHAQFSI